jgi:hypothetical protein
VALGDVVVVPVISPVSASELTRLAARLAKPDGGTVIPVTVVGLDADDRRKQAAQELLEAAVTTAQGVGVTASGVMATDRSVVAAVLSTAAEHGATLMLMGWRGGSTTRNVFGELIDSIVGRSRIPLAIVRTNPVPFERVVVPVSQDHLLPAGARGLALAADLADRLRGEQPVTVLRTGELGAELPAEICSLADRIHHDPRRVDLAVGAAATAGDLIVAPVAPTASGLRTATTHMAWAAPDPWLLVALDVGPTAPDESLAEAVSGAGRMPSGAAGEPDAHEYSIAVTARVDDAGMLDAKELAATLRLVGSVEGLEELPADGRGRGVKAVVVVVAPDANVAVGAVLTAVHESDALLGTEITYELGA